VFEFTANYAVNQSASVSVRPRRYMEPRWPAMTMHKLIRHNTFDQFVIKREITVVTVQTCCENLTDELAVVRDYL